MGYVDVGATRSDIHTCTLLMLNEEAKRQLENQPELIDSVDANGSTAIVNAAERGNLEFVQLLCDLGASPNVANHQDVTPMDAASHAGPWKEKPAHDVVTCLIEAGATLTIWKKTALGCQAELEAEITAGMLNQLDEQGRPALFYAAKNNHLSCVNALLMAGADPTITCNDGQTALSTACLHSLSGECDIVFVRLSSLERQSVWRQRPFWTIKKPYYVLLNRNPQSLTVRIMRASSDMPFTPGDRTSFVVC